MGGKKAVRVEEKKKAGDREMGKTSRKIEKWA